VKITKYNLPWSKTAIEAISIQKDLAQRLVLEGELNDVDLIAGVDCSSYGNTGTMVGAIVVWSHSKGKVIDQATAAIEAELPYIPGLLGFREIPALLKAFNKLNIMPEAVICDGQGTAHMRGFGIACHLGLYIDVPTVGCGKSRLVGSFIQPDEAKGSITILTYKGCEVGRVVRTRTGVQPVFVSPGHKCGMDAAVKLVTNACTKYRLPEPIRAAHKLSGEIMGKINNTGVKQFKKRQNRDE